MKLEHSDSAIRIFYAHDGPGDVIGTYRKWAEGDREVAGQVSVAFSAQFYDLCEALDAQAYVVSPNSRKDTLRDARFTIEHRPKPRLPRRGGLSFYLVEAWHALGLIRTCLRFRSRVAVVADSAVWPIWALARLFGVRIVAVLHCALWPAGFRPAGRKARLVQRVNRWFWENVADATLGVSSECIRQVRALAPDLRGPTVVGLSYFRKDFFDGVPAPTEDRTPFRVMFAGRIEENKGVFDVVRMAKALKQKMPDGLLWEMCGSGEAEAQLQAMVQAEGLSGLILLRGRLGPEQMAEAYGRSHAVVVPTTSDFAEGLNQVAIEAILAGRPLLSSRLCHALDLIGDAVVEVPPNDVAAYATAIRHLAEDREFYEQKRRACGPLSAPFYDRDKSWGCKLRELLTDLLQQ